MKTWWKKALAITAVWLVAVIGGGVLLTNGARSQYAADKIIVLTGPVLVCGLGVIWAAAYAIHRSR